MKPVIEIAISFILQMLRYLSSTGIDPDRFLQDTGVDITSADSPDTRISIQQFYMIQETALKVTGDRTFGLHLGEFVEAGSFSILGYIIMNCSTLSGALERICRYQEVVGNFIQISMSVNEDDAVLTFSIPMPDVKNIRHCYEAAVSSFANMIKSVTLGDIAFNKVTFTHSAADDLSEYNRILRCPISFNDKKTTIVFNKKDLDTPIAMHNPGLLELFEQHAKRFINQINAENNYTRKVNSLIMDWLTDGTPTIDRVAKELSISVRSLQMRLNEEGVTFRQLLENIRKELATSYLKEQHFSIDDITYLLGFSEPSIFRKTFKKWTGVTPGFYRNQAENRNRGNVA